MPKVSNKKPSVTLSYDNEGEIFILYNPAPVLTEERQVQAQNAGTTITNHRDNTGWYFIYPALNVTMPLMDKETPVMGWVGFSRFKQLADGLITQLKAMKPAELQQYQTEIPIFKSWSADQLDGGAVRVFALKSNK